MLDFTLKPLRKYTIACTQCNLERDKRNTKTLTVYRDTDGFIRWQCSHAGQCIWNERQWIKDPSPEDVEHLIKEDTVPPLKSIGELPKTMGESKLWWYHDEHNQPRFAAGRKDNHDGKKYFPVTLQDGVAIPLPSWPDIRIFYGHEKIQAQGTLLVVEGEKAADAAQGLFPEIAAITWRGGAANTGTAPWESLKGKKIYLWPDNDDPGRAAMSRIADLIGSENEIYMVDTTVFPPKSDLADQLDKILVNNQIKNAKLISNKVVQYCTLENIEAQELKLGQRFKIGWPEVDEHISFPATGVLVLEGRTGHAKTGSAINIAYNVLRSGGAVHYFSYEIPASRVYARFSKLNLLSPLPTDIDGWIHDRRLKIYDQSRQLPLKKLKEILDNEELRGSLVVVDYAQIVPTTGSEMRYKMIDLMDSLRILANTHGFLVLLLSQLTPDYSNPLHDAPRDAKDIHFSAEMVIRVWNKDNEWGHPIYDDVPGNFVMHVVKNRDGESGHIVGFAFDEGVYLEPNGTIVKAGKKKKEENKSTLALETIANVLQRQFGGI